MEGNGEGPWSPKVTEVGLLTVTDARSGRPRRGPNADGLVKVAMSGDVGSGEGDEECRSGLGSTERVEGCA